MSFDHNDHYHPLLLRQVPKNCRTALDVGCGTGRFARRLAASGIVVDAINPAEEVVAEARRRSPSTAGAPNPSFVCADVTDIELPRGHYDFISCLASIHHVPFDTVATLRDALAPGGVLVILGCHPERTPVDWAYSLAAVPVNAAARLAVAAKERLGDRARARAVEQGTTAPVRTPTMPLSGIRREAAALLPGCAVRRLLFWRYLLVYRARP
ncbi:class I SAM-dependent methyltransferase [Embleya sp. NPDC050493]|uniref:class I SAM-dependent methyltransferase n=1 Tax=Embleya sp. NPDC050493 TaxID=3363989 RepID=UPI00379DFAFA